MSAPHIAGSALLLKAAAPDLDAGPDQVGADDHGDDRRSSRRTRLTPADPFDIGAGRVDLTQAGHPRRLTFDESATNFAAHAHDPLHAIDLNMPSVNAPIMPGSVTTEPHGHERHRPHAQVPRDGAPGRLGDHVTPRTSGSGPARVP